MKRSLANSAIRYAEELLNQYNFKLPEFGYWNLNEWRAHKNEIDVIKKLMLGGILLIMDLVGLTKLDVPFLRFEMVFLINQMWGFRTQKSY